MRCIILTDLYFARGPVFGTNHRTSLLDRVTDRRVRIGKKPNEADLSYTTVRTGLTNNFFGTTVREESKGKETRAREYHEKTLGRRRRTRREDTSCKFFLCLPEAGYGA